MESHKKSNVISFMLFLKYSDFIFLFEQDIFIFAGHKGEIVECMRKYVHGIYQKLQSLSPY